MDSTWRFQSGRAPLHSHPVFFPCLPLKTHPGLGFQPPVLGGQGPSEWLGRFGVSLICLPVGVFRFLVFFKSPYCNLVLTTKEAVSRVRSSLPQSTPLHQHQWDVPGSGPMFSGSQSPATGTGSRLPASGPAAFVPAEKLCLKVPQVLRDTACLFPPEE